MWAYEFAQRIINERPNEEVYTVASGVSPSGFIHIGNFAFQKLLGKGIFHVALDCAF